MIKRALIVKSPFAGWIVDDKKHLEFRNRPTNIRERIGIIQAGTGTIIGEVDLIVCYDFKFGGFAWKLSNAKRYKKPKHYNHPQGAQIWVRV